MKLILSTLFCFFWVTLLGNEPQIVPLSNDPLVATQQLYDQAKAIYKEQPDEALPLAEEALVLAYTTGYADWITYTQYLLAQTAYKLEDFSLAYEMFSMAKAGYAQLGDEEYVGWCYLNLGNIHTIAEEYVQAKALHRQAEARLEGRVSDSELAQLQRDKARVSLGEGKFTLAITQLTGALTLAPTDPKNLSYVHYDLGYCYRMLGQHEEARHHYYESFQVSSTSELVENKGNSANELALYAYEADEPAAALAYAQAGYQSLDDNWHSFALENKLVNRIAESYFALGQPEEAYAAITQLLNQPECENAGNNIFFTYNLLIEEYLKPYGSPADVARARREWIAHSERIDATKQDMAAVAAAAVAQAEADMKAAAAQAQAAALEAQEVAMAAQHAIRKRNVTLLLVLCFVLAGGLVLWHRTAARRKVAQEKALLNAQQMEKEQAMAAQRAEEEQALAAQLAEGEQALAAKLAEYEAQFERQKTENREQDAATIAEYERQLADLKTKLALEHQQNEENSKEIRELAQHFVDFGERLAPKDE